MMTAERASIFQVEDDGLDLGDFAPTRAQRPDPAIVRRAAETNGFKSREPQEARPPAPQRRHRTGRNRQLNLKVTEDALNRFYAIADREGWVLGQAFEKAITALEADTSNTSRRR